MQYETSMASPPLENDLRAAIRTIPEYRMPGTMFRDIAVLLGDAREFILGGAVAGRVLGNKI